MKLVAAALLVVGMLCNSMLATGETPVPFRAMMQSASAQPAVPARPNAKDAYSQSATSNNGKTERIIGGVLLGAGIATITATLVVVSAVHGSDGHPGRVWAGVGGGAGLTGAGVSLIVLGSHRRPSN